jgi:hypothetical protein
MLAMLATTAVGRGAPTHLPRPLKSARSADRRAPDIQSVARRAEIQRKRMNRKAYRSN